MTKLYETDKEIEKVVLVGVDTGRNDISLNFLELTELVKTSGAEVVGETFQKRSSIHPTTYIGKGKIEELKDYIALVNATGIVCDDELNSNQLKTLTDTLDIKVMDRTMVILDIFARRAFSAEGKTQVELAQLKYSSSRLTGLGKSLSRQAGTASSTIGIGSRGPGEKKLEMDRRYIKERILELESEIKEIKTQRSVQREQREQTGIPVVSLVGYTNAGKSTLMNKLTNAQVLSEDKLFATLDTTTRKLSLPMGREVLLTDTVGFIQKLPHTLINAFNATLEELKFADVLIHIVDISNPDFQMQMETVYDTLENLGCGKKLIVTVFNKIDLLEMDNLIAIDNRAFTTVYISAMEDIGVEEFLSKLEGALNTFYKEIEIHLPFSEGSLLEEIYGNCQVIEKEYTETGTRLKISANEEIINKVTKFQINN